MVSENIATHEYESKVLAKAFTELTGIEITHDLIGEGDVVEKLQTQMQSGENIYDAYVNDSDLIGRTTTSSTRTFSSSSSTPRTHPRRSLTSNATWV